MNKATKDVSNTAKASVVVNTGRLRSSISTRINETNKYIEGVVFTNVSYAHFIEFGTGPRGAESNEEISPNVDVSYRSDKWTYYSEDLGRWITTYGMPARPYLYPALKNRKKQIKMYFVDYVNAETKKIARLKNV